MREIGRDVKIHPDAEIDVKELIIGDFSVINAHARLKGRKITIGREAWIDEYAYIGGGRAEVGELITGDFLHCGERSQLNIADKLTIGNEVGIGIETKIFTHGAYLDELNGFPYQCGPVEIGNRVWLPNAWVNPRVKIGNDVVVCAMSLVNRDIPDGCLAGGIPAKIIKSKCYPRKLTGEEKVNLINGIISDIKFYGIDTHAYYLSTDSIRTYYLSTDSIRIGNTDFYLTGRVIEGIVTKETEIIKNVLRRRGIRFRYFNDNGVYRSWDEL